MRPTPARAAAPDAGAWLPLPDVDDLPEIEELVGPEFLVRAARPPVHRGGDVRPLHRRPGPVVRPSPARATPHDPGTWFPIAAFEEALEAGALVDSGQTRAVTVAEPVGGRPGPEPEAEPELEAEPALEPARLGDAAARRAVRTGRRWRAIVLALVAVVIAAAAGASVPRVLASPDRPEVTLRVDGKRFVVETGAATVGELLADQGVRLRPNDRVEPPRSGDVRDGLSIAVLRAFPVTVDVDGALSTVETTRTDPTALQHELGLDPEKVVVKSAPDRLGRGATVVFRTLRPVTIAVDGTTHRETSTALNVTELLEENAVVLGPFDQVAPPRETLLADDLVVTVVRIGVSTITAEEPLPFATERVDDPSLQIGEERVVQEGRPGIQRVTYQQATADGQEIGVRTPISRIPIWPAVPKIVAVGTALPNERTGSASWYASPFGPDSCATKTYVPMGTILRVTNLDTGASTTCRVADRVVADRVVDLDDDVFRQLAPLTRGVFNARIEW